MAFKAMHVVFHGLTLLAQTPSCEATRVSIIRQQADPEDPEDPATCNISQGIVDAVATGINAGLKAGLAGFDPLSQILPTRNVDLSVPFCEAHASFSTELSVSGLSTAEITEANCTSHRCLEPGFFGCKKGEYTLAVELSLGDILTWSGRTVAETATCRREDETTFLSKFDTVGASALSSITVQYSTLNPLGEISEVGDIVVDLGESSNFTCESPDNPASTPVSQQWCADALEASVQQLQGFLEPLLADILKQLINGGVDEAA